MTSEKYAGETPSETRSVLIVDHEPNVALMLAESLESLAGNYHVETASGADEALSK